jgi:hypothetical protein
MTVRATALRWLALHHRVRDGDIFASRYYPAAESWTGRDAWWLQIPVHRIEAPGERVFHLLCETAPGTHAFHYLRVPASFLRGHLREGLDRPGDGRVVSLFLAAEPDARFRDERGAAHVELAPFLQPSERA